MDWNQDGNLDIVSGCYSGDGNAPGHIQILYGQGAMEFAESTRLLSKSGAPLQNTVTSHRNARQNICTEQHIVDYDGDGDLDLVSGCFANEFYLFENVADTPTPISDGDNKTVKLSKNQLSDKAVALPIASPDRHSAPHLVDWDDDGDLDLISGSSSGAIFIWENTGTSKNPQWAAFEQLVVSGLRSQETYPRTGKKLSLGKATRVWATDFNGDGLLDLLVGDHQTLVYPANDISDEVYAKKNAECTARESRFYSACRNYIREGNEQSSQFQTMYDEVGQKLQEIRREFESSEKTGFVWLLIRKRVK